MNKQILSIPLFLYPFIFGILMWLCWPPIEWGTFLVFIGYIPLFLLEDGINKNYFKPLKTVLSTYVTFLIWNIFTTWWVALADIGGGVAAMVLNAVLMTIPFYLFAWGRHKLKNNSKYKLLPFLLFVGFWSGFEQLHLSWELTWPWLTLGNVFSMQLWYIKLYSITGIWGGTVLVLMANIFFFLFIKQKEKKYLFNGLFLIIIFPILGWILQPTFEYQKQGNIVMVQPNYDAYLEKFSVPSMVQQSRMMALTDSIADDSTSVVLWPETSIVAEFDEKSPLTFPAITNNINWMKNKKFSLIAGSNSQNNYGMVKDRPTETARKVITNNPDSSTSYYYYDLYNTATFFPPKSEKIENYHKSRLVPGVERMPYPGFFAFLEPLTIKMGGTFGSVGTQKSPSVFNQGSIKTAPVICYESIFGDYVSQYIRNGANCIAIITNDDWWGASPGYIQHFNYGRLRAIESGKYIYRSANTGISGIIDPNGKVIQKLDYRKRGALKFPLYTTQELTIYSQISEWFRYISYISFIGGFIFLLLFKKKPIPV